MSGVVEERRGGDGSPPDTDRLGTAATGAPPTEELRFAIGDVVMVSGLPGSGKTTLIERVAARLDADGGAVRRVDSHGVRESWERRLPPWLPYAVYRPGVRIAHFVRLARALRSGGSVVVHDCGGRGWVRRWAARDRRRRGGAAHLVLLDVPPSVAAEGQRRRGRGVPGRAFDRHCRTVGRLASRVDRGRTPDGCASATLLDRRSADALRRITFG
ncbi:ATP-binding protein [Actinomadura cremea]|nr:ATP-binding protein [Actinomadura cremea]